MRKFLKRFFQFVFILLLLIIVGGIITVTVFEDEVVDAFTKKVNKHLNAEVKAKDIELTFLSHFPNLALELKDPLIYDAIEGSKDTLLSAQSAYFAFNPIKLISKDYTVKACYLEHGFIRLKVDENGYPNYNLVKPDTLKTEKGPVKFELEEIGLLDVKVVYINQQIKNNHAGHIYEADAMLSVDSNEVVIDLQGDLLLDHLGFGDLYLFENKPVSLNSQLVVRQKDQLLTIKPSNLNLSGASFSVQGAVGTGKETELDVKVHADKGDAQTLISLLPEGLRAELAPYKSKGTVYFDATLQGVLSNSSNPQINVEFGFENAAFYHPESHHELKGAYLTGSYTNGEKQSAETSVIALKNVKASLKGNPFQADFELRNFDTPYMFLNLNGDFDMKSVMELAGIDEFVVKKGRLSFKDVKLSGYVSDLQSGDKLHKMKSQGQIGMTSLDFVIPGNQLSFRDFNGEFLFNKTDLGITSLKGRVGNSDFAVTGFFKNFVTYIFGASEQLNIQGDIRSAFLDLDELLQAHEGMPTEPGDHNYSFSVSPHFACDIACHIERLKFRNLKGANAGKHLSGAIRLRNQVLTYHDLSFGIAGGQLSMRGRVDARKPQNILVQNYGKVKNLQVDKAFFIMENFGQGFLTDRHIRGTLHAEFYNELTFNEKLELDLPQLNTAVEELVIENGKLINFEPMMELGDWLVDNKLKRYLKKPDLSDINFSKLTNQIFIEQEKIIVPEMVIQSDAASDITVSGTHTFDQQMNYSLNFPLVNYQRQDRHERLGIKEREGKKHLYIYLDIVGTTDDYEIISDNKQIIQSGKEKLANDIKQTFQPIEEPDNYYGIDTEDTLELLDVW